MTHQNQLLRACAVRTSSLALVAITILQISVTCAQAQSATITTTTASTTSPRPNILFIMSDDHAAHAISAYGSKVNKTPHIDRLAREGIRLENCFATNALCAPSRATILTGKYSHLHGMKGHYGAPFDSTQPTYPPLLQKAGYQTAVVGKWHLKSWPVGFDYWNILINQGLYNNPRFIDNGTTRTIPGYATDVVTDLSIEWLKEKRDPSKPFLLLTHHKAPHRNFMPNPKHAHLYNDPIPKPATYDDDYSSRSAAARNAKMRIADDLTSSDVKGLPPAGLSPAELKDWHYQRYMQDYLRCVASVDDNVGRLLDYLDTAGLTTNTLVIYTSDQGFFLGDHGWYDKRFMYEESLRMPFLARLPGVTKPGATTSDFVINADFAPTFLDLAGIPVPPAMQGASFRKQLQGEHPADWRKSAYYHFFEFPEPDHMVARHYGVRTDRYKLIHYYNPADEWELFDLKTDPHELRNLYNDTAQAETIKTLKQELARLRTQYQDTDGPPVR